MMEALRGLGYSTATALADIIDNSVAADAGTVDLTFSWNGKHTRVLIEDDGRGMSADELDSAMRLGDRNPLDRRAENDLGRFGLGLKTASFSQCRRLTVASAGPSGLQCLRWDLDVLAASKQNDWQLLEGPDDSAAELVADFGARRPKGTLVVWEVLDRIVRSSATLRWYSTVTSRGPGHSCVFVLPANRSPLGTRSWRGTPPSLGIRRRRRFPPYLASRLNATCCRTRTA
jgi:hypothetical protein